MKSDEVSRRFVVGALGIGAATVAAGAAIGTKRLSAEAVEPSAAPGAPAPAPAGAAPEPEALEANKLIAPLGPGDRLSRWTIQQVLPVQGGAASVVLQDDKGQQFQLDVCARDEAQSAPVGPGHSELFQVFLANSGDGSTATFEDHGLAAMALAEVIRANEQHVDRSLFSTQAHRVATNKARTFVT